MVCDFCLEGWLAEDLIPGTNKTNANVKSRVKRTDIGIMIIILRMPVKGVKKDIKS